MPVNILRFLLLTAVTAAGIPSEGFAQAPVEFRQKSVVTQYPDFFGSLSLAKPGAPVPQDQRTFYLDHAGVYLRDDLVPLLPSRLLNFEVRKFTWGADLWFRAYDVGYFDYSQQDRDFLGYFGGSDGDYTLAMFLKYRKDFDPQTLAKGWRRASRPGQPGELLRRVVADQQARTAVFASEFLAPTQAAAQVGEVQARLIQAWARRDWGDFLDFVSRQKGLEVSFTEGNTGRETHPWAALKDRVARAPANLTEYQCPLADAKVFQLLLSQVLPGRGSYTVFPNVFVGEDIQTWRQGAVRPIVCEYQIWFANQGKELLTDTRLTLGFVPEDGTWRLYKVSGWVNLE